MKVFFRAATLIVLFCVVNVARQRYPDAGAIADLGWFMIIGCYFVIGIVAASFECLNLDSKDPDVTWGDVFVNFILFWIFIYLFTGVHTLVDYFRRE